MRNRTLRFIGLILVMAMVVMSMPVTAMAAAKKQYYGTTSIAHISSGNRKNIKLAVAEINGMVLGNKKTFSFNDVVGSRRSSKGYVEAENGRGVDVTGGGVAQVAATIYMAIKGSSYFDVKELHTYGSKYTADYVESGDDAVVVDYSAGTDFRFTNRTGSSVTIRLWLDDDSQELRCSLTRRGERIARASTDVSGTKALKNNINLAAKAINGTTLSEGDKFSFNDVVGARSERRGYEVAINGRGVDVRGGGVSQVASTLYLAIKNKDDFKIIDKSTYGSRFTEDYVDSSRDAIVTDYSAGTDFSFRYRGDGEIQISMYVEDGELICEIYET